MKIGVRVMLKNEVLDVEGRAVADTLKREGTQVDDCRVGKYIILDVPAQNLTEAKTKATEIARQVLSNPLIEVFIVEEVIGETR